MHAHETLRTFWVQVNVLKYNKKCEEYTFSVSYLEARRRGFIFIFLFFFASPLTVEI